MSVDGVDRANHIQETQNLKDTYDERERELIARHRRELAEAQKKHQDAITHLKTEYSQALQNMTEQSRSDLSSREKRHIKEIQDMQDVNRKRMAQQRSEDEEKFYTTRNTLEGEIARQKDEAHVQQKRLTGNFDEEISKRDEQDKEMEVHMRESSQAGIRNQADRLEGKFEKERQQYRDYIAERNRENDRERETSRKERERSVKNLENKLAYQRQDLDEKFRNALQAEREQYHENVKNLEDGYQQAAKENRERYALLSKQNADRFDSNFEQLESKVNERVSTDLNRLKHDNNMLKTQNSWDKQHEKMNFERQKQDITNAFQQNVAELEDRRLAAVAESKGEYDNKINEIQKHHDRFINDLNTKAGNKLREVQANDEANRQKEVGEVKTAQELNKIQTDRQKRKLAELYAERTISQAEANDENIFSQKKDFEQRAVDQRSSMEKKHADDITAVRQKADRDSMAHQEKFVDTVTNYESKINALKAEYEKKLRKQEEFYRDQSMKQVKSMDLDRETTETKLQARMNAQKESYERELEQLRRRHAQERQALADAKKTT